MAERWLARAACRGPDVDARAFFPPPVEELPGDNRWDTMTAKTICVTCPVRRLCLAEALGRGEDQGVWGGFNLGSKLERAAAERGESPEQPCAECGQPFISRPAQRVCSTSCAERRSRRRYHGQKAG